MKKYIHNTRTVLLALLLGVCTGCNEEIDSLETETGEEITTIRSLMEEGSLLIKTEQNEDKHLFYFETDTLVIPYHKIIQLTPDIDNWKTTLLFADNTILEIPTLGTSFHLSDKNIKLDPTGYDPLSAELNLLLPTSGYLTVCVKGKHDGADLSHTFKKYGSAYRVNVHGLYENHTNTVYITQTNKQGKVRLTDSVKITVPDLQLNTQYPQISMIIAQREKMEPGVTLINFLGDNEYDTHRPFIIDNYGDIRWLLRLKDHPEMRITAHTGLKRNKKGNFYCGDVKTGRILEFDMVGNILNTWNIQEKGYSFHHDVIEIPNGHLIATASKDGSIGQDGKVTTYDYVVEVDNETGAIVNEWDLKKSLDETRKTFVPAGDTIAVFGNWAHGNAVIYSEDDDCIIVSCRYQGVAKLTRNNQLKWIMTPHKEWKNSLTLLKPLDAKGEKIADIEILNGEKNHDDFEWCWGQHCPVFMPNGNILLLDNGFYRNYQTYDKDREKAYTRSVEYKINEEQKTIQQVWEYGKERGKSCFAMGVSSTDYLPKTNHVLFCPGVGTPTVNGRGGRIIEVDYKTKEVISEFHFSVPNYLAFHRANRISLYPEGL